MPQVTEMLCMFCLRSVTTVSPVCEKDDTITEYTAVTRCHHLMHISCFLHANLAGPVTCQYPNCTEVIDSNQVVVIEADLKCRNIVESVEEKQKLVDELTTHLTLATCNLELATRLKEAEDKIAQLEANVEHHVELIVEADKCATEAKAAELDANKRYDAAEGKIAQLEASVEHNAELLAKADKRASEARAAELKAKKLYDVAKDKITKLEADAKRKTVLLVEADKRTSKAKAAELDAKKRYNTVKDKMAQLEDDAKRNTELLVEANKRTSEAKAAELDAKKRYDAAEDKIAQLEATAKQNAELLVEANKRTSEAKAAELKAKKRYDASKDKITKLEADAKRNTELLVEADKRTSKAKAAELDAKKRYNTVKDKMAQLEDDAKRNTELLVEANKRTSEAKAAELDAKKHYNKVKDKMAQLEDDAKHYSELLVDANKRTSEAKEAELKAKKRYDAAKDNEIAKLKANTKHFLELAAEADKRTSKAKAAELDAKKRYELVVGKLHNQLIACTCIASDSSVLVLKDCNELLPPGPTSPIAPSSSSNNALETDQNQQVVRVKKTDTFNVGNSPNKECLKMESIADFPNALADLTPMSSPDGYNTFLPFSESMEGSVPKETIDVSIKSSIQHHVKDPRLRLSSKKSAAIENPISEFTLSDNNTNHSPQNTSSESSIADEGGSSRHSRSSSSGYCRKMTAQGDRSPAAKRWKGPSKSSTHVYKRYWQRFGIPPPTLNPFFPLDSFPMGYTVAGIQEDTEKVRKVALLAYDVLLLGDGHAFSVANYVLKDKPFKDQLSESLYRRNLSIIDLMMNLNFYFTVLPEKIILSIGNWDATQNMPSDQFITHFKDLLQIFKKCQVKVVYTLPIITYPGMDLNRAFIAHGLSVNWSQTIGIQHEFLSEMVKSTVNDQHPVIDDKGPMYEVDKYASLVAAIRDRFIPVATTLPTKGERRS